MQNNGIQASTARRDSTETPKLSEENSQKYESWSCCLQESRLHKAKQMIMSEPPGAMLDVGCSSAHFTSSFISLGWTVYGIDINEKQVEEAQQQKVKATVGDIAEGLPFESESFNLVFAGEIIEHLIDTDYFLSEVNRVLRKEGTLLITTPNLASLENRLRLLRGKQPLWLDWKQGLSGHVRAYTGQTLQSHLRQHNLEVESFTGNFVSFASQPFSARFYLNDLNFPWLRVTGTLFPGLSCNIILKARKVARVDGEK